MRAAFAFKAENVAREHTTDAPGCDDIAANLIADKCDVSSNWRHASPERRHCMQWPGTSADLAGVTVRRAGIQPPRTGPQSNRARS